MHKNLRIKLSRERGCRRILNNILVKHKINWMNFGYGKPKRENLDMID